MGHMKVKQQFFKAEIVRLKLLFALNLVIKYLDWLSITLKMF